MTAEDRRVRKSKHLLKQSLVTCLKTKPLDRITVSELVRSADLNRSTFYQHFTNLDELYDELVRDTMNELIRSYREPYLTSRRFDISELTASSVRIFEHVYEYGDFYSVIIDTPAFTDFRSQITELIRGLISDELLSEPPKNLDANMYAGYHAHAITGLITDWVDAGFDRTPDYMNEQLLTIIQYRPAITNVTLPAERET
ncbi:TetR/AcrR family transcriptional regulator [Salisediminibacterium halotolerans]|uniref:DNA-binding transcriptional regulator, AcrR family n=1 Tax=Salisediminibacterium halotolerans TaxID=517425 RepID=A0A1H9U8G3_9BACI|nr:TetR/AcrR family transcriptional regulator [Salisediminibacterium haloalkalitolerans]SES05746.1 DNA-binding transcriptional regulator, AcrR family [Salisediminibacterium haloalkalitolerans]